MEQTDCSETSAYKIQTPGNYPEENIQHTEQGGNQEHVTLLSTGSDHFRAKSFSLRIPLHFLNIVILHLSAYEDGTDRVFRNVGI